MKLTVSFGCVYRNEYGTFICFVDIE